MSTTVKARRTGVVSEPVPVVLVVPDALDGAVAGRCWRRLIHGVNPAQKGSFALTGVWLDAGTAYQTRKGALVVACDVFGDHRMVRLLAADTGGFVEVKTWRLKAPLGKRVVDYVARRLAPDAHTHQPQRLDPVPNRWDGYCRYCRNKVPAGTGRVIWADGRHRLIHHPGKCPPPPPPPEVITPNRYAGLCYACGNWVAAGAGAAILRTTPDEFTGARYQPAHAPSCPADGVPGPTNRVAGWCADCGEIVKPGSGYWHLVDDLLRHRATCPAPTYTGPTWVIRRRRDDETFTAGQVRRVQVDLRHGGPDIPMDAPGRRVLAERYIELVGVLLEVTGGRRQKARIRAATAAEAADLLGTEASAAVDARPCAGGFPARFTVEQISPRGRLRCRMWITGQPIGPPWLTEITGRDPDYGYARTFLTTDQDWTDATRSGSRGVRCSWTLMPNRVYQAWYRTSWKHHQRVFLRATPDGDVVEISREEVETWLNTAPTWPAH